MKCPYCESEMTPGSIQTLSTLSWMPQGEKLPRATRWSISENAILLSRCGIVQVASVQAQYCKVCNKIIIDVPE